MPEGRRWRQEKLDEYAYRPVHPNRQLLQEEQDRASGGQRRLRLPDAGTATARVKLVRKRHARRIYAALIWDHDKHRTELQLGEVTHTSRAENLRCAWAYVQQHQLLTPSGRTTWSAQRARDRPRIE